MTRLVTGLLFLLALAGFIGAAGFVSAAQPRLSFITPPGGARGGELEIVIHGTRLADAVTVLFAGEGVQCLGLTAAQDGEVHARIRIAPDCPLGPRGVYIQTRTGLSDTRLFSIGALKEVNETEPDNTPEQAQKIELNCTVNGVIQAEDVDCFAIDLPAGQRVNFEVEGLRLGDSPLDPLLALLDPAGHEVAMVDDIAFFRQDCAMSYTAPAAGRYVIQVREAAYGGGDNYCYRLHVGTYPRPLGAFPAGGRPGEALKLRLLGDPAVNDAATTAPATLGVSEYFPVINGQPAPSPVRLHITTLENRFAAEANHTKDQATTVTVPGALNGILEKEGAEDWYGFDAKKDQGLHCELWGRRLGSPLDSVVSLHDAAGNQIATDDDAAGGVDSMFDYTIPHDGRYFFRVRDHLGRGGALFFYRLEVGPPDPTLAVALIEDNQAIAVPLGNRLAQMIEVRRGGFDANILLTPEKFPPGLEMAETTVTKGMTRVPVLFRADKATTIGAAMANLIATPAGHQPALSGRLAQDIPLVKIMNDQTILSYHQTQLPLAVTKPVPFSIDLVEPKAPLVRNGVMRLLIKATRVGEFKVPIDLRFLYNPPGVSAGTAKIEAGQTTATLELNADGGAGVGDWPIAVIGTADIDEGGRAPVTISTQLVRLTVTEPYLDITLGKARAEQGTEVELVGQCVVHKPFTGDARVELTGLPGKLVAEPQPVNKDAKEIKYKIKLPADAPVGTFNPFALATITEQGEPVVHRLGAGELRIDTPLPPKVEPTATPAPQPAANAPTPTPAPTPQGPQRGDRKPAVGLGGLAK